MVGGALTQLPETRGIASRETVQQQSTRPFVHVVPAIGLCLLLFEDRADGFRKAGEQFASTLPCFLQGFLAIVQKFDILPEYVLSGF
jgi:hypothetical protein